MSRLKRVSHLENKVKTILHLNGYDSFKEEFKFCEDRKWRFDFADPESKIAIECDGGVYSFGRHTRGKGYENDTEKNNQAAIMGWTVLHYTPNTIKNLIKDLTYYKKLWNEEDKP